MTDTPIDYRPDGSVVMALAEGSLRLRRPTLGEYRRLREALHDVVDRIAGEADEARATARELDEAGADETDPEVVASLTAKARVQQRQLTNRLEDLRFEWLVYVAEVLGDRPLGVDDALPWMTQPQVAAELVGHWRSVPSRSGAPGD